MSSSLLQWESDPLFSAAEVVQDSADRMDSVFRLLLHELSLLQQDHPEPRLLKSIEYHRRDLATLLEATRWQLEDFEKAVNISAIQNENRKDDVTLRHKQFVSAIRQHISNVENSLDDESFKDGFRNYGQVGLSDQDQNGLALFLSGGNITEQVKQYEMDDSTILRRFLDPVSGAGLQDDTAEIVECRNKEIDKSDINGVLNEGCSFGVQGSLQEEIAFNGHDKDWDVEANEATNKAFFQKSQPRGKVSQFFSNLCGTFGCRITTNYTKKLKDGEDQMSPTACGDTSHTSQCRFSARGVFAAVVHLYIQLAALKGRYERTPYYQANKRAIHLLFTAAISVLTIIGLWLSRSH